MSISQNRKRSRPAAEGLVEPAPSETNATQAGIPADPRAGLYCGHCGRKMQEVLHSRPVFDRVTGAQTHRGVLHWECPRRGTGAAVARGDWEGVYDANPHDSTYLNDVSVEAKV